MEKAVFGKQKIFECGGGVRYMFSLALTHSAQDLEGFQGGRPTFISIARTKAGAYPINAGWQL